MIRGASSAGWQAPSRSACECAERLCTIGRSQSRACRRLRRLRVRARRAGPLGRDRCSSVCLTQCLAPPSSRHAGFAIRDEVAKGSVIGVIGGVHEAAPVEKRLEPWVLAILIPLRIDRDSGVRTEPDVYALATRSDRAMEILVRSLTKSARHRPPEASRQQPVAESASPSVTQ